VDDVEEATHNINKQGLVISKGESSFAMKRKNFIKNIKFQSFNLITPRLYTIFFEQFFLEKQRSN
jgi:hypothetical protein